MRTAAVLFALILAPLLAGCFDSDDEAPDGEGGDAPAYPYSRFLCADGGIKPASSASEGNGTRCNVRITGNPPGNTGPANELTIAVDPTNPLRLIAGGKDYNLGPDEACGTTRVWAGYYWTDDGGFTWRTDNMPGHDQDATAQPLVPLAGYRCTTDPVAYWDLEGRALFSGLSYAQGQSPVGDTGSNVWLAISEDGGATYPDINVVAQADGVTVFHDKQWFTFDPATGNMYFTWSMFVFVGPTGTDQIVFSRSTDGGQTWTPPRVLAETQRVGPLDLPVPEQIKQFSMPQVDLEGRIYVLWMGNGEIWFTTSEDEGVTWSQTRVIAAGIDEVTSSAPTGFRVSTYPVLAIDRSNRSATQGNLYVVYAAQSDVNGADIFLIRSTDGGSTWSEPVRVNDDATRNDQFMPWVEVGPRGDVHVIFVDRRDDPRNRLVHTYYAHSDDGASFDPNVRVSELPMNSTRSGHQGGFEFVGDYIGVTEGANGWVHPIWVDTRHGRADAYTTILVR